MASRGRVLYVLLAASWLAVPGTVRGDSVVRQRKPLSQEAIAAALDPKNPADLPVLAARKVVEAEPQSVVALIALGDAYLRRAWIPEALESFLQATKLAPDSSMAWNDIGITYELQGEPEKARSAFAKAVKIDPRNAQAHYNLGTTLERDHDFDAAITHYREALRLRPELGDPIANPRSHQANLLLPVRLSLYLEASGSRTLPPQVATGEASLKEGVLAPSIAVPKTLGQAAAAPGYGDTVGPPAPSPAAATPTPSPTPIVLGPQSINAQPTPASDLSRRPLLDRTGYPRSHRGGPLPPKPTPQDE